ncbi:MAG: hypothetical protein AB4352_12890 [Hormoscilla sp.]
MRSRLKTNVQIISVLLLMSLTVWSCAGAPQGTIMLDDDDEDPTPAPEPQETIGPEEEKEDRTND